jgi:hypothetical protein
MSRKIRNRAAEMEQRTRAIGQLQQKTWTKTEKIKLMKMGCNNSFFNVIF